MKKKGLIIATIVMVLVLAVSLTTATYAWFAASNVTKIDAFTVQITSNNPVAIGVKTNNYYNGTENGLTTDAFQTGTVSYTAGTAGVLAGTAASGTGSWSGDLGLSANIDHDIAWGSQSKAVGFKAAAITDSDVAEASYVSGSGSVAGAQTLLTTFGVSKPGYVYAANSDSAGTGLANIEDAIANVTGSHYVYLCLGVSPTKNLGSSEMIITVDTKNSAATTLGLLSALKIAYRKTNAVSGDDTITAGEFTVHDIFGSNLYSTKLTEIVNPVTLTSDEANTYQSTYSETIEAKYGALKITGLSTDQNVIDIVELYIYIDGTDSNAITSAVNNVVGNMHIFFHTTDA